MKSTSKPKRRIAGDAAVKAVPDIPARETSQQRQAREAKAGVAARNAKWEAEQEREAERKAAEPRPNPLPNLPEKTRAMLFGWMRECPFDDAVIAMLDEQGIPGVTRDELNEFFELESDYHWQRRMSRAAQEANALVRYVEANPVQFSNGILAALGQEAFRMVSSGEVEPEAMAKMTNLFLKAKGDERAGQALELKRQQVKFELRTQTEKALEVFAREVEEHPRAKQAFETLRAELLRCVEEGV